MIRTVVVPLDGSRFAETALPVAFRLARAAHARLGLVLVNEAALDRPASSEDDQRAARHDYLAKVAKTLGWCLRSEVRYDELEGPAESTLVRFIEDQGPDLIVMATRGRGVSARGLGSVAGYVSRHVSRPVLLVHAGDRAVEFEAPIRRALVVLDATDDCGEFLAPLADLALALQFHITLLQVEEQRSGVWSSQRSSSGRGSHGRLEDVACFLRERGVSVATRVVGADEVRAAVLDQIRSGRIDLVAVTPPSAGEGADSVVETVKDQIIQLGATPILTYRPRTAVSTG